MINEPQTQAQRTYMHAVAVADRMLAESLPVLGVGSSADGQEFSVTLLVGDKPQRMTFPLSTSILHALARVKDRVASQAPVG